MMLIKCMVHNTCNLRCKNEINVTGNIKNLCPLIRFEAVDHDHDTKLIRIFLFKLSNPDLVIIIEMIINECANSRGILGILLYFLVDGFNSINSFFPSYKSMLRNLQHPQNKNRIEHNSISNN